MHSVANHANRNFPMEDTFKLYMELFMRWKLTFAEKPPVLARTSVTLAAPIPPSND